MSENFSEKIKISFGMPFQDTMKLLIGTIICALPVIRLLIQGYFIECSHRIFKKEYKIPDYNDFPKLLKNTLFYILIEIVYLIPLMIISFILVWKNFPLLKSFFVAFSANLYSNPYILLTDFVRNFWDLLLIIFILLFITTYFIIAATLNYSVKYDLKDAFDIKKVIKLVLNPKYFAFFLLIIFYSFAIYILLSILFMWIPGLGNHLSSGLHLFITGLTQYAILSFVASEILFVSEEKSKEKNQQVVSKGIISKGKKVRGAKKRISKIKKD